MKKILVALILVAGLGFSAKAQEIPPATCKITVTDNTMRQDKRVMLIRMQDNGRTTSEDLFLGTEGGESSLYSIYGNGTYESFYVPEGTYLISLSNDSNEYIEWHIGYLGVYRVEAGEVIELTRSYRIYHDVDFVIY